MRGKNRHSGEWRSQGGGLEFRLKDAAELEEPFLVAGCRLRLPPMRMGPKKVSARMPPAKVAGKFGSVEGVAVHFADFGKSR